MPRQAHAAMRLQHCQDHRQSIRVPTYDGPARGAECRGPHQRLDFNQQRPRSLDACEYGGAGAAEIAFGQK